MRLSLKDLFGIVAFCGVLAWCALQVGWNNGMYWTAVVVSAAVSVVFVHFARDEARRRLAFLAPVPFLACCLLPVASLTLFTNAGLLLLAGVLCFSRPVFSVRTLWGITMVCAAVALVVGVVPGRLQMRRLAAMRTEFPIVSLEQRLEYEQRQNRKAAAEILVLSNAVSSELDTVEQDLFTNTYRQRQLKLIHDLQYELFVRATGFGVTRMMRPVPSGLRRPPLRDIPFSEAAAASPPTAYRDWLGFAAAGKSVDVEHLHTVSRNDFLDADSLGQVDQVGLMAIGFVEHAFHYSPVGGFEDPSRWTIERIELLSLLKFDEPRVYQLEHLPRMDQLSSGDVPTRALDSFETDALDQLRSDRDLVTTSQGNSYRMLGSLRAANRCLDCHSVERGALLGAFSYSLHQSTAAREESAREESAREESAREESERSESGEVVVDGHVE